MRDGMTRLWRRAWIVALVWAAAALAAPTLQIIYPRPGADVEGVVNLRVFAYEGAVLTQTSQVDTVKFFRKADSTNKIMLTRIAATGEWSGVWNASSLSAGTDTLVFRGINSGASTKTDSVFTVTIANGSANSAPTVDITSPAAGSSIAGTQAIAFTATAGSGSIATREISVDGGAYVNTSGAASHNLNTVPLADGAHTVRIRITNSNGAATESRLTTYYVANAPGIAWLSPAGGSTVTGRLILNYAPTARGSATIASDSLLVDGAAFAALRIPDGPDTLDVSALSNGNHTFQIKTTDNAGKTGLSSMVSLLLQNGPWISLASPQGGSQVSGRMALTYHDSAAAPATVVSDSLLWDGKVLQGLSLSGQDTLNTTAFEDGEHSLQLKATDSKGRAGLSSPVTLLLRNGPTALIDSSLADSTVSGRLVVRFRMSAVSPATLSKKEIALDGGPWRSVGGDSTDTVDTRALSEGAHTVQVKATDSRGKSVLSRLVKFNVKNAPTVAILSPAVDAYEKGTVTIRFKATAVAPDSIKQTQISIGGGEWESTPTDTSYNLDTRNFKDGDLRFQVRAIDGHGKAATTLAREIVVDNAPPKISYPATAYPGGAPLGRRGIQVVVSAQGIDFGSGMDADSAMVFSSTALLAANLPMHDDGKDGDKVAGDNVYSLAIDVGPGAAGEVAYSVRGRDALGNDTTVIAHLLIDDLAPALSLQVSPPPGNKTGSLKGEVYTERVLVEGAFNDNGPAGMASATLSVRNPDSGHVNNSPDLIPILDGSFRRVVELVPGRNLIALIGVDKAGNADTLTADLDYVVPKATRIIPNDGGSVLAADGSGVIIPKDALGSAQEITVRAADSHSEPKPSDADLKLVGVPHEFGPDGAVFPKPVIVTLAYTEADLDRNQDGKPDFSEDKLTLVFWNGSTWLRAGDATIDKAHKTVSVGVNHFTLFDLAEDNAAPVSSVVTYWDRNPVPGHAEFVYKLPKPGTVSLSVLDMAGDLDKQLLPPGTRAQGEGSVRWDGSNVRGRFSGAGLYVYVFRYKSDDGTTEKLIRKPVGLVRE